VSGSSSSQANLHPPRSGWGRERLGRRSADSPASWETTPSRAMAWSPYTRPAVRRAACARQTRPARIGCACRRPSHLCWLRCEPARRIQLPKPMRGERIRRFMRWDPPPRRQLDVSRRAVGLSRHGRDAGRQSVRLLPVSIAGKCKRPPGLGRGGRRRLRSLSDDDPRFLFERTLL